MNLLPQEETDEEVVHRILTGMVERSIMECKNMAEIAPSSTIFGMMQIQMQLLEDINRHHARGVVEAMAATLKHERGTPQRSVAIEKLQIAWDKMVKGMLKQVADSAPPLNS